MTAGYVIENTFPGKPVGGCTSYDVIVRWPDLTRSIFFCQKLCKGWPISYTKFQRDPLSGSAGIKKAHGGMALTPHPPPPARARVKIPKTEQSRDQRYTTLDRPSKENLKNHFISFMYLFYFILWCSFYFSFISLLRAGYRLFENNGEELVWAASLPAVVTLMRGLHLTNQMTVWPTVFFCG